MSILFMRQQHRVRSHCLWFPGVLGLFLSSLFLFLYVSIASGIAALKEFATTKNEVVVYA